MLMALCTPHQELHRLHAKSVWVGMEAMVVSFDYSFTVCQTADGGGFKHPRHI
jgi:hypothetical protein